MPVAGGPKGAADGTLVFMVGSDTDAEFERSMLPLNAMGAKFIHAGSVGAGQSAKIAHNMVLAIQMMAASEGLALGEKLGIDPKKLTEILQVSTANSAHVRMYNPRPGAVEGTPSSRDYEGGFQVQLMKKDVGLALESAAEVDATTELG